MKKILQRIGLIPKAIIRAVIFSLGIIFSVELMRKVLHIFFKGGKGVNFFIEIIVCSVYTIIACYYFSIDLEVNFVKRFIDIIKNLCIATIIIVLLLLVCSLLT